MRRGTTPTIDISIRGVDVENIELSNVTIKQDNTQLNYEIIPDSTGNIRIRMSQEDTLKFRPGKVSIQVKLKLNDGNVVASKIYTKNMDDILNTGVI